MLVLFDSWCPNCRKFANLINRLDWLNLINFISLRDFEKFSSILNGIEIEIAKKQMASYTNKWRYGFISIYYILIRVPLFWAFIPLLYFLKITKIGQYLYIQLSLKRKIIPIHCDADTCNI